MTKTLIQNGRIVNEGKTFDGYIVIDNVFRFAWHYRRSCSLP